MSTLAPGTPCFLTGITEYPDINGRVVDIAHLVPYDEETYRVVADWIPLRFEGREVYASRRKLLPIVPPTPPGVKTRRMVPA